MRLRRVLTFLLAEPGPLVVLVAVYVGAGIGLAVTDYALNDEGLLTHYWASFARRDFVPVFFFQRSHPVLSAFYAGVSAWGHQATMVAHVLVAATALPMVAATARSLGYRLPNLPALLLAVSPLYFFGGPAGFANVDGVVGITLVLYLLCARRLPVAAGLVAGLLPWMRFELGTFSAVMAVDALVTARDRRFLLGIVVFPLAYAVTGALYHHDALWLVHFPASTPVDAEDRIWESQMIGLSYLLEPALALTPVAALAVLLPVKRLQRVEIALLVYAVCVVVTINVLPMFRIGNFGAAPRYMMHLLPALALLVGRALEPWWEGERPGLGALLGAMVLAVWLATRQVDERATGILLVGYTLVLAAAWLRRDTVAVGLATMLAVAGPLLPLRTDVGRAADAKYLGPMVAWLMAHPAQITGPIYTNSQLLGPFLERRLPGADVVHMAGPEMVRGLGIGNPNNGQRERIWEVARGLYGKTLFAPIAPDDLPGNALLVIDVTVRVPSLLPPATWSSRLDVLAETPDFFVARLRPGAPAPPDSRRGTDA